MNSGDDFLFPNRCGPWGLWIGYPSVSGFSFLLCLHARGQSRLPGVGSPHQPDFFFFFFFPFFFERERSARHTTSRLCVAPPPFFFLPYISTWRRYLFASHANAALRVDPSPPPFPFSFFLFLKPAVPRSRMQRPTTFFLSSSLFLFFP